VSVTCLAAVHLPHHMPGSNNSRPLVPPGVPCTSLHNLVGMPNHTTAAPCIQPLPACTHACAVGWHVSCQHSSNSYHYLHLQTVPATHQSTRWAAAQQSLQSNSITLMLFSLGTHSIHHTDKRQSEACKAQQQRVAMNLPVCLPHSTRTRQHTTISTGVAAGCTKNTITVQGPIRHVCCSSKWSRLVLSVLRSSLAWQAGDGPCNPQIQ
jgi:hypothetical protein